MNNESITHRRIPGYAFLLSILVPGLGQLYCGNLARALAFACVSLIGGLVLGFFLLGTQSFVSAGGATAVLGLAICVAAGMDAFLQARKLNSYQPNSVNRPIIYSLFVLLALGANLGGALGFSLLIRDRFVEAFVIPNRSMSPTIEPGDRILALKNVYLDSDPKRGDVVIFRAPDDRTKQWIKRVVALPGERIAIREGKLFVDGKEFKPQGYEVAGMEKAPDFAEVAVPAHHCFVLGDNRADSKDSRHFGALAFGAITARVETRFWPLGRTANLSGK